MKPILGPLVANQTIRGTDSAGSGMFGASRKRKVNGKVISVPQGHQGIDIVAFSGQSIKSPIQGEVIRIGKAYQQDKRFELIEIFGQGCYEGYQIKILYIRATVTPKTVVQRGQLIGVTQDLNKKYKGITNHVHLEVRFNGQLLDPTNLFGPPDCEDQQVDATITDNETNNDGQSLDQVIPYSHSDDNMSISSLLSTRPFNSVKITTNQFAKVEYQGITNHRRIYNSLTQKQKKKFNQQNIQYNPKASYPITNGCELYIPVSNIEYKSTLQSNITVTKTKANKYFAPILTKLTNDPGYVPAKSNFGLDAKDIRPQITIWVWSRILYNQDKENSGFIDISNDVIRCDISNIIESGGNFTITLQPIVAKLITKQQGGDVWHKTDSDGETSLGSINVDHTFKSQGKIGSEYINTHFYYNKVINQNDLVFISFEKLQIEGQLDLNSVVANNWYDMIGMVDLNTITHNATTTDVTIEIRGRDMFKALQEDNSYFNPYSIGHINSIYGGSLGERFLDGKFKSLSAILPRSVQESVEFIFHRIASIGYVPDDVFSQFINKTEITQTTKGVTETQEKQVKGVWQIIKVFIDQSITRLRLVDDSIANPQGSVLQIINKIAQQPFVEFFGDTYGDKFYLIFRQPPFTFDALFEAVWNADEVDSSFNKYRNQQDQVGSATPQQINKYQQQELDDQKANKKSNQKNNIIQNENSSIQQLDAVTVSAGEVFPKTININQDDVLNTNLQMSNEAYAWYKLTQRGNFAGNTVSLGHVPALYFDQYAQVFGNKMLEVTSNYSDYYFFSNSDTDNQKDLYAEQASQILAYLVETNIYLPFTREGTITINGDRRIKKGHWIYYRPTKEMYYVQSVDNSISINNSSIDRTTTLRVERGMIKSFIRPKSRQFNGQTIKPSYFNIVDIDKLKAGIYDTVTKGSVSDKFDYKSNIALNQNVFDFFIQNNQFENRHQYEE